MTIKGIGETLGVSTVTIYRRLKQAGIDAATLRDDNNDITAAGAATIANLFRQRDDDVRAAMDAVQGDGVVSDDVDRLRRERDEMERRATLAEDRLEIMRDRLADVLSERDRLREDNNRLLSLLEAEQRNRLLLTGQPGRRGLFGRWRR